MSNTINTKPKTPSKYFLLTKPHEGEILDIDKDQIIYLNQPKIMIIPREYIGHHSLYGIYESSLMTWIAQEFSSKDKLFIDIGAHTGTFSVNLAKHFKHVYAFEPQKMTYYALCGSVALSNIQNVTCIHSALGSQEQSNTGSTILYITSEDGGSSSMHRCLSQPIIQTEIVPIKTMDFYAEIFKKDIGVIKMDVENNEIHVLKGALKCIKNSDMPMIFFECSKPEGEVFDYLHDLGYITSPISNYANMYLAEKPK